MLIEVPASITKDQIEPAGNLMGCLSAEDIELSGVVYKAGEIWFQTYECTNYIPATKRFEGTFTFNTDVTANSCSGIIADLNQLFAQKPKPAKRAAKKKEVTDVGDTN